MLIAVAFPNRETGQKIAELLGRHGLRAIAVTSGAAVLRQAQAVTGVVCTARLEDMTVLRLRRMLPMDRPIFALTQNEFPDTGIDCIAPGVTRAQLCEAILCKLNQQDALLARAKHLMIQRGGVDEQKAHHLLQLRAMNEGIPIAQAAEEILRKYGEE